MNEIETTNAMLEMLLSIESKVNALIRYEVSEQDLDNFNYEVQNERAKVVKRLVNRHPSIGVKLSDGENHK